MLHHIRVTCPLLLLSLGICEREKTDTHMREWARYEAPNASLHLRCHYIVAIVRRPYLHFGRSIRIRGKDVTALEMGYGICSLALTTKRNDVWPKSKIVRIHLRRSETETNKNTKSVRQVKMAKWLLTIAHITIVCDSRGYIRWRVTHSRMRQTGGCEWSELQMLETIRRPFVHVCDK